MTTWTFIVFADDVEICRFDIGAPTEASAISQAKARGQLTDTDRYTVFPRFH